MPAIRIASVLLVAALFSGCEMLGIESAEKVAALKEAEGKAIGSACRHANRAIEDCYALNPRALKAAAFAGWREMDEYMRENKLEAVAPAVDRAAPKGEPVARAADDGPAPSKPGAAAERKPASTPGNKAVHAS